MKTFEERYTAWIDGQLTGDALREFEKELAAHPEARAEREAARQLGDLLRKRGAAPTLGNPDFFNLQLLERIEAEQKPMHHASRDRGSFAWPWSFGRLAWLGATCLAVAGALYFTIIPRESPITPSNYFAQVVEAWPADPSISATTVYNPEDNVTVLWLDGLEYLPGEQLALQ